LRPIRRSKLRLLAGRVYYKWRRYAKWWFGGIAFEKKLSEDDLSEIVIEHSTPTLRKLKDVDMWLQIIKERI
jgi:vancomycin resistance protein VanW